MKKITLFLASVLFVGVAAMYAQEQDTTATDLGQQRKSTATESKDMPSSDYTKDMLPIQVTDIPAALRSTLQGSMYKGWENGTFYRSKTNEGYALEIKDGEKTKMFRFDANGKPIRQ